jgi:hypothetical protein
MIIKSVKIKIDFMPERENPQQILAVATQAIDALNIIDSAIVHSISKEIGSKLLLEGFEKGSLVISLMRWLEEPNQESIGANFQSQQIAEYVERSRDSTIQRLSGDLAKITSKEINEIIDDTNKIAQELGISDSTTYATPNTMEIAEGLSLLTKASNDLDKSESISMALSSNQL